MQEPWVNMARIYISVFYSFISYSQEYQSLNQIKFDQIHSVGFTLPQGTRQPIFEDSAFIYFITQKTKVLDFLIDQICDTTLSNVEWKSSNGFLKKGDLATILLSYIEFIPYASITGGQWCICCETGYIPVNFFSYLDRNRLEFQSKYKKYCAEKALKRKPKRNKKR